MAIMEIFSSSFLFSIAIIIILSGLLFAYLNYRMSEQDHKLNSMLALVSSMANETQFFRSKINAIQQHIDLSNIDSENIHNINLSSNQNKVHDGGFSKNLINVSDGEEEEDDDDDYDDDSNDDDSNDDDGLDEEEDEEEDDDEEEEEEDEEQEDDDEEEDDEEEQHEQQGNNELSDEEKEINNSIKVITLSDENIPNSQLENIINNKSINLDDNGVLISNNLIEELIPENLSFLNTLSMSDLGDTEDVQSSKNEYKKMPINKLREVVINKGLTTDASKLKKNEILKLLGEE